MTECELPPQCQRVLDRLRVGPLTQSEALNDLGVWRLASRITDLRNAGYIISKQTITVKNRFDEECSIAEYRLHEHPRDNAA